MSAFIVTAAAMICAALGFLIRPLVRSPRRDRELAENGSNRLVEVYRDQIKELESDVANGVLAAERRQESRQELEDRMLGDLSRDSRTAAHPARRSFKTAIGVLAILPIAAGLLYWVLGNPAALRAQPGAGVAHAGGHGTTTDQIAMMAERLARKLEDSPDNADGWAMLARSLVVLERYGEALAAFQKAAALLPDDAALLADYADAVAMTQNGRLAGKPMQLVRRALVADPANPKALALAGTDAFDRRDYQRAAQMWDKALRASPPGSEFAESLRASLGEARSLAGMPAVATGRLGDATIGPAAGDQIAGRITVAPDLKARIPAAGTLFIYARAESGPRMPVAILRRSVKELGDRFVLDDRAAMSPDLKISGFKSVIVSARISASGDAMPATGDLIGSSGPVSVGTGSLDIEINGVVR